MGAVEMHAPVILVIVFNYMQFWGKMSKIIRFAPSCLRVGAPVWENQNHIQYDVCLWSQFEIFSSGSGGGTAPPCPPPSLAHHPGPVKISHRKYFMFLVPPPHSAVWSATALGGGFLAEIFYRFCSPRVSLFCHSIGIIHCITKIFSASFVFQK